MGTLVLSGVLKRPVSGDVIPNARIIFGAIATGSVVLKGVSSSCKTASDGSYSVELEYGDYAIQVSWAGQTQQYGTVHVDDTTPIGSLNDLLMEQIMESQLTPEIVLEFRQLEQEMRDDLAEMQALNTQATGAAAASSASATAAGVSEANAAVSEQAASVSASAAGLSESHAAESEAASAASAAAARSSESTVAASADASAASAAAASSSETHSAASEEAAAASAAAASASEVNAADSEGTAAASASAASQSENNAAASEASAANSATNAKNARDAAEEYAQEAKDAASKVTAPLTDQGMWAIQSGYPVMPDVASIWQITDGGVDPLNSEIIWDPGDMLVYLASTGTWCRLLGQQTQGGEPVPIQFDSDIILDVGAGLQIVSTGTAPFDVVRLDTDNNLVIGDKDAPGILLSTAEPANLFVLVPDGQGGYTRSRIYSEAFPPPEADTSHLVPDTRRINGHDLAADVDLVAADIGDLGDIATHDTSDFIPYYKGGLRGKDLNALTGTGVYDGNDTEDATDASHYPWTSTRIVLTVVNTGAGDGTGGTQVAQSIDGSALAIRASKGDTAGYGDWLYFFQSINDDKKPDNNGHIDLYDFDKDVTLQQNLMVNGTAFIAKNGVINNPGNNTNYVNGYRLWISDTRYADIYLLEQIGSSLSFRINLVVDGVGQELIFKNDGTLTLPKHIYAGAAIFNGDDGDIDGSVWGGWLSNYLIYSLFTNTGGGRVYGWDGVGNGWLSLRVDGTAMSVSLNSSDARLKSNIKKASPSAALDIISKLEVVSFNWIPEIFGGKQAFNPYGLVAQQVQQVLPDMVTTSGDEEEEMLGINDGVARGLMLAALQAVIAKIDDLESRLNCLEAAGKNSP